VDSQFLKFWGELLLQAAKGKRLMEAMPLWLQSGTPPSDEVAALFRQCYGLPSSVAAGDDQWQNAMTAFKAALQTYAPLWGWVPLDRYTALKRENERLETTVAEQTQLIQQLESLLKDRGMGPMTMLDRFQTVIDDQSQAFEKLMQALASSPAPPDENER
jgi:hypothetical protein